ncbi:hypothetical protein HII17_03315 [Thalassotalea sp. M1531]|uniref:Tetratricopeptide repeat protein n=1 Tax=Thalassotalea algicola TaxID=2716224 RepID=A0A7Y0LAL4_9GAMM|nr:hypothetical protein [Thalassotalea algicola]NMP30582.1 hypothetical protein [Thalassotalea algicola]
MSLRLHNLLKITGIALLAILAFSGRAIGTENTHDDTELADKFYRQALFYYFSGDYGKALRQISLNRQRFSAELNVNTPKSQLFEAGLLVSVGMHKQATQSLLALEQAQRTQRKSLAKQSDAKSKKDKRSATSPQELMLIARLQLAEQQVQQGNRLGAQQTLAKVTSLSNGATLANAYYEQYYTLSQIAYWPEQPELSTTVLAEQNLVTDNAEQMPLSTAYITLNQALLAIENSDFERGEAMLVAIKNQEWQATTQNFWQLLFNPFSSQYFDEDEPTSDSETQQQAVNDYAQLLLAQLYVKQQRFESAYYELKEFPQYSPYTESALFTFAYAAQKHGQYSIALTLLALMQKQYPYSNLAWQSAVLFAGQVAEQKSLAQGLASYEQAEQFYLQRLTDLNDFQQRFLATDNLLDFVMPKLTSDTAVKENQPSSTLELFKKQNVFSSDEWLQKALLDPSLKTDFQYLKELDLLSVHLRQQQQKSHWLADTIKLNKQRKSEIVVAQQQQSHQELIAELKRQHLRLSQVVELAEQDYDVQRFSSQTEADWLKRIKKSKQLISSIDGQRNIEDYQERLSRVEGVLTWRLSQKMPIRLWQHKKQLAEIAQQLSRLTQQQQRFETLASAENLLVSIEQRHLQSNDKITELLTKLSDLRAVTSNTLRQKVYQYAMGQRQLLQQHLLTARHEMAAVLEQMSTVDKRIESQLMPMIPRTVPISPPQDKGRL